MGNKRRSGAGEYSEMPKDAPNSVQQCNCSQISGLWIKCRKQETPCDPLLFVIICTTVAICEVWLTSHGPECSRTTGNHYQTENNWDKSRTEPGSRQHMAHSHQNSDKAQITQSQASIHQSKAQTDIFSYQITEKTLQKYNAALPRVLLWATL